MQTLRCLNPTYDAYMCRSKTPAQWFAWFYGSSFDGEVVIISPNEVHVVYKDVYNEHLELVNDHTRVYSNISVKVMCIGPQQHEHKFSYEFETVYPPTVLSWFKKLFKKKGSLAPFVICNLYRRFV